MKHRRITQSELSELIDAGESYETIGQMYGLSASGVYQAAKDFGLTRPQLSHKWALPWTLAPEHKAGKIAKYLRDLSSLAQGKQIRDTHKVTAIRWAEQLVAQNLDVAYRRDEPPNDESAVGGFYTVPASRVDGKWHLKHVLDKAKRGVVQNL
ncbi:hypothetical protein [Actinomadura sp. WMMB 499]|uniref:hypothetical protein n=1 Tax=Actinomadura sp. WMMB 499 TaxID=1219491 RepID=UPI00124492E5|nr:hypothetical protein [Actinomadura sp. WMMB 499]QFG25458.1 hypothetical protein F7P10_34260 [Actinomadura sp. WMMB 499]